MLFSKDIICAIATPSGSGAIAVIRISGDGSLELCDGIFKPLQDANTLLQSKGYTLHYGTLYN
ncbi:MAG: tRNA uridine-5-carboxymethylaminomethyl(34) synthesis GTPase MnmE, partial [Bacteroidota bacterium]